MQVRQDFDLSEELRWGCSKHPTFPSAVVVDVVTKLIREGVL